MSINSVQTYALMFWFPRFRKPNFTWNIDYKPELNDIPFGKLKQLYCDIRPTFEYVGGTLSWLPRELATLSLASKKLGLSKAIVYQAKRKEETAANYVYKKYMETENYDITVFEKWFTEFLIDKRSADMPRVVAMHASTGELIKKYEAGLTYTELVEYFGEESVIMKTLNEALKFERKIVRARSSGFTHWFKAQIGENDFSSLINNHAYLVLSRDNHKNDNWIFSVTKKRWILIDP